MFEVTVFDSENGNIEVGTFDAPCPIAGEAIAKIEAIVLEVLTLDEGARTASVLIRWAD